VAERESAAVLHAAWDVQIEQREITEPGRGQVLVEIAAVGICGSDVHYFEHGALGRNVIRSPHILGHELSGRVVAQGPGVDGHRIGERVTVEPGMACGSCGECAAGRYNLCTRMRFLGTPPVDGGLRGHLAVPAKLAFPLPHAISDAAGALIEPLAVAVWASRRAGTLRNKRVLVTGAGTIGLLVAQVARASGAGEVRVVDVNDRRLARARQLGISEACSPGDLASDSGHGADVLFECAGAASALAAGVEAVRPAGTVVVWGWRRRARSPSRSSSSSDGS